MHASCQTLQARVGCVQPRRTPGVGGDFRSSRVSVIISALAIRKSFYIDGGVLLDGEAAGYCVLAPVQAAAWQSETAAHQTGSTPPAAATSAGHGCWGTGLQVSPLLGLPGRIPPDLRQTRRWRRWNPTSVCVTVRSTQSLTLWVAGDLTGWDCRWWVQP